MARAVVRDAWRKLWRPVVPSVVLAAVVAAAAVAIFATTGLALASQQRAFDRMNSPEGRLITVVDTRGTAGIDPRSVQVVQSLSGVEWAVGVGPARTVSASAIQGGPTVTAREIFGTLPPIASGVGDRLLLPGQAVAGPDALQTLGFVDGIGHVSGGIQGDVIGRVLTAEPLSTWNNEVLIAGEATGTVLSLHVSVTDLHQLQPIQQALRGALVAEHPEDVTIETTDELAVFSADVINELTSSSRQTVSALLTVVAILVAAVQFGRVAGLVKEIGRRRALGATRSMVVTSVLLSAALAATIGALIGTALGVGITAAVADAVPRWEFMASVPVLMVLTALAGGTLPAVRASRLDPVAILRIP